MSANEPIAIGARYVFPVAGPPLADGVVTVAGERIVSVGDAPVGVEVRDLGNVALLPGLVNAHTHLEFSDVSRPLGTRGMALPDWIRDVVHWRRGRQADTVAAAKLGLRESNQCGTTTLGEIATSPVGAGALKAATMESTVFLEAIGLSRERTDVKLAEARRHLAPPPAAPCSWRPGLSPHAPYTVHPELFTRLLSLAASAGAPVAFHLAESPEELELLASGGGTFRKLLEELGAWDPTAIRPGARPLDYLKQMTVCRHALVIHGNYLDAEEIAFVAAHADRLAVVYCPRTHAYFGHVRHPLPRLLAAGASLALGTDSRASNPDLSVLEEVRFVARQFPELPLRVVLELGTLAGAKALGQAGTSGTLEPGKLANLAAVYLPEADRPDPHELLLDSELPVLGTCWRGEWSGRIRMKEG